MYVLVDMEWISNQHGNHWPTQLAAARVDGQHRGSILLYAHTHNTVEEAFFQKCVKELNENKKLNVQQGKPIRAINVGCMMPYMNYEPRTLKEILSAQNARKE